MSMTVEDWAEVDVARDAFFADDLDPKGLPIEERELWHQFATSAERRELARQVTRRGWSHLPHDRAVVLG